MLAIVLIVAVLAVAVLWFHGSAAIRLEAVGTLPEAGGAGAGRAGQGPSA